MHLFLSRGACAKKHLLVHGIGKVFPRLQSRKHRMTTGLADEFWHHLVYSMWHTHYAKDIMKYVTAAVKWPKTPKMAFSSQYHRISPHSCDLSLDLWLTNDLLLKNDIVLLRVIYPREAVYLLCISAAAWIPPNPQCYMEGCNMRLCPCVYIAEWWKPPLSMLPVCVQMGGYAGSLIKDRWCLTCTPKQPSWSWQSTSVFTCDVQKSKDYKTAGTSSTPMCVCCDFIFFRFLHICSTYQAFGENAEVDCRL